MLQKAIAGLELADKSYMRIKRLYDKGVTTRQQYDEALAAQQAMQANVDAAHAEYRLVIEGATREQKQAAEAKVREARGAVDEVNTYINDACVYAPVSGRISNIIAEPGELVSAGYPVITILDLTDRWIVFNIKENAMHALIVGDRGVGKSTLICRILEENGYTILERTRDYNDRERAVLAQLGGKEEK